ncbi:MAG: hypothetical protein H6854_01720 [Rhodospirillales bacterium]|nr:hypothetical protein [Rhodospirillales bacterium]
MKDTMTAAQNISSLTCPQPVKEALIRLPYRVGLWLSQSDQTGGDSSDEQELYALENVILSYGEDVCKSEFTQSVMEQTVKGYEIWDTWRDNIENVPRECETILYEIANTVDPKHLRDFKSSLLEIAETVALAYRETSENESFLNNVYIQIRILQKKWDAFIKKYDFSLDHALNISPAEEEALKRLKGTLRI